MKTDKDIPAAVVNAILKRWPDQAVEILEELEYDHFGEYWHFTRWGMYVGVERDGYIHT